MSNAETLQQNNLRLNENNIDMNSILDTINKLPEQTPSESLEITPSTENQEYSGMYDNVKVNAVTSEIDSNIVPENIKEGTEILGVTGTFAGGKYAPRYISFRGYTGTELNDELANLDTSKVTDMNNMFCECRTLTSLDVSNVDTSNVTNMSSMFKNCRTLTTLNLDNFNTSKVTDMNNMFYYCQKLTSLDLSSFDTSKVTDMNNMFYYCQELTSLDVSNFDTSKVTDMNSMFSNCKVLTSLDLSNWNTSNVTNMFSMFYYCQKLTSLDLSSFDTSKVTNMNKMFSNCKVLTSLDIRNFTFDNVIQYIDTFQSIPADCEIIVKGDTEKAWVLARRSDFTNVKTVAELGA